MSAHRKANLKARYAMTPAQWDALFLEQGSQCGVCGSKDPQGNHWATDHDHSTGDVRGILCRLCNLGLGHFRDCQKSLRAAVEYLDAFKPMEFPA